MQTDGINAEKKLHFQMNPDMGFMLVGEPAKSTLFMVLSLVSYTILLGKN